MGNNVIMSSDESKIVYNVNQEASDSVDRLCQEAKDAGMTVINYVKSQWSSWNEDYDAKAIYGKWAEFLNCVDKGLEKIQPGEGIWGESDTFDDYLHLSVVDAVSRLDELKERKEAGARSFVNDENILANMNKIESGVGERVEGEFYEFIYEIIRRSMEIMRKCVGNEQLTSKLIERGRELEEHEAYLEKQRKLADGAIDRALLEVSQKS